MIFLAGSVRMFFGAAGGAILPKIVPEYAFTNAVTWQMTSFQLAGMVGPALGGALIALASQAGFRAGASINAGATLCYTLAALLIIVTLLCLYPLRLPKQVRTHEAASLADVFQGVRFVFREKLVLSAVTLDLFAVLFGGAVALMPVFARDVLMVGPIGFGALRIAPAIGASVMALVLTRLPPIRNAGATLLVAVAGFGLATIVFALSRNLVLSLVALGLTGAFDNISMVIRGALVPLRTPDAMRGRVGAVERVFISSSNELGGFESGLTASWWGAVPAVIVGGIGTLVVVSLVALGFPQLRGLGRLDEIEPAEQ
jgi:MFS family permease